MPPRHKLQTPAPPACMQAAPQHHGAGHMAQALSHAVPHGVTRPVQRRINRCLNIIHHHLQCPAEGQQQHSRHELRELSPQMMIQRRVAEHPIPTTPQSIQAAAVPEFTSLPALCSLPERSRQHSFAVRRQSW